MITKIKIIHVVYTLLIILVIGGGLLNLQTNSQYWPGNNGALGIIGITKHLLFLIVVSFIVTLMYALVLYIWKKDKRLKFTYIELIEVFIIIAILLSIPLFWLLSNII